jgi:hypothetical protein
MNQVDGAGMDWPASSRPLRRGGRGGSGGRAAAGAHEGMGAGHGVACRGGGACACAVGGGDKKQRREVGGGRAEEHDDDALLLLCNFGRWGGTVFLHVWYGFLLLCYFKVNFRCIHV